MAGESRKQIGKPEPRQSRGMADGGIGVGSSPGQNGSAITDQITCADQPTLDGGQDAEHKERLADRGASPRSPLPLLGGARNAGLSVTTQRQAAGQRSSGPGH